MSPIERLFMDAGLNFLQYQRWRLLSLKTMAALERLHHGWPVESFDDEASELRLARIWLENNAPQAAADRETKALESTPAPDPLYGPLMTTSEAKELIQQEIEAGKPVTLKAFENALRQASKKARGNPEELPCTWAGSTRTGSWWSWDPNQVGTGRGTGCADDSPTPPVVAIPPCDTRYRG